MSGFEPGWVELASAVVLFALGLGLGRLSATSRGAAKRVRELEAELAAAQRREEGFRESVGKHFDRTSDLFRDLTREYTALYAHLSEGARELCPDREPELASGLSSALLGGAPAAEAEAEAGAASEPPVPSSATGEEGQAETGAGAAGDSPEPPAEEREAVAGAA